MLSQELITKHARFSLKRYPRVLALHLTWPNGFPVESTTPVKEGDTIRLDSRTMPAFEAGENLPPECCLDRLSRHLVTRSCRISLLANSPQKELAW
jgi:hypothetical protein